MKIFLSVNCYLPETLPQERRSEIAYVVEANFGKIVESIQSASHIVTNSNRFEGWQDVAEDVEVVNDMWVDRSMILGKPLPCQFYSADPAKIFSGVVACVSGVSAADLQSLRTGVITHGGEWRNGLTKDVTHLFATSPDSDKYATAIKYQETTKIKVLVPHWFDDALRLGFGRKLSTTPYEWPVPKVFHPPTHAKSESGSRTLSNVKRAFYRSANWDPDKGGPFPGPAKPLGEETWGGRKLLLSPSLGLEGDRRHALEQAVEAAGGMVLSYTSNNGDGEEGEEFDLVSECDVLVTRWRSGRAFFRAAAEGKVVGTLTWVFCVHTSGTMSSPMDQLLHYPARKVPIEDFSKHQITVTNYTGDARDYIKRLIHTMGAKFTPNMSNSNTVLIAAHMGGEKTRKALSWSIPLVNHTWLEDCFVQWRALTPAVPKYMEFPANLDFTPMLADARIDIDLNDLATEEEEDIRAQTTERPPVGTEASLREVEGILDGGDIVMDDEDAIEREECLVPIPRSKASDGRRMVPASVSPTKQHGSTDDEMMEDSDVGVASKAQGKGKAKAKAGGTVTFAPETETDSAGPSNTRAPKKPPASASTGTKRKVQLMDSASRTDLTDTRSDSPPPRKRAKSDQVTSSDAPSTSAPSNGASTSSTKRKMIAGPGRNSGPLRSESLRVLADERPGPTKKGVKKPPAISAYTAANSLAKPQRSSIGTKRMSPDETDDDNDVANNKRRTQQARGDKGKQREEMNSAEEMPPPKASKSKAKGRKKDASTSSGSRGSRKSATNVKIMTTSITLPDNVLKALSKLGVKTVTKVSDCTHLITPKLVRTEKFLGALASGVEFILTDKWVLDSIAANKLLPEEDYILHDEVNERKWDFSLLDAMERAKENGGKLFENKTFYVTSKIPFDTKLLKNVVNAQGGKLVTTTPTLRTLNSAPGRYIISCAEDISVWRPLTKDHVIYSPELLLTSALTQEIDWDNPAFRVPDSST
ncbi:hypothetical protein DFH07DRAFT_266653 [Mycena maculata]|uniref:BRCT domain-containing protein n=1 Tax=Mycena maculata TaxID=230809 RepID=A0AAD7JTV1_9AGAR|nr:hypothetical protein DFH07DRAFT_266653 [Mycena maculata]